MLITKSPKIPDAQLIIDYIAGNESSLEVLIYINQGFTILFSQKYLIVMLRKMFFKKHLLKSLKP
jgi:hypothetical protein